MPGFLSLLALLAASGCAHKQLWPDEPGVPVEPVLTDNVEAAERFLSALSSRRKAVNLTPPIAVPRYQEEIRAYATDLQSGKISAVDAEHAIGQWGRSRYGTEVSVFMLDCSAGEAMPLPPRLIELPTAVIAYAAAHFRPRSLTQNQCAILLVAVVGSEAVRAIQPKL